MTRARAIVTLYKIINSGLIDIDLEETLTEIANCICYDDFEECEGETNSCEGCIRENKCF